ncbi:MAG: hypothetical protein CO099_11895 [Bdellovibrio sp. CG_4_9_14_3_um_filter_39_7]|nr:MAG: hypothetical protein CO099_11895 [Bdellovibrio sp. CG_4_9_14_3_um_filter_39_7]
MKYYLTFAFILTLVGCSSVPVGNAPMKRMLKNGAQNVERSSLESDTDIIKGTPLFVRVKQYPQVLSGGIVLVYGEVVLSVGREVIDLEKIIKEVK